MTSLNFSPRVPVFDANIGVGHRHDQPAPFEDAAGLLGTMHRHGVDRAVVYHVHGESISAIRGNEILLQWTAAEGSFSLQWMAGPGPDSLRQLRELRSEGRVQSVRLSATDPDRNPLVPWLYGDLLEWLSAERIPLWISLAETPARDILDTLSRYPDLVTVLLGAHYTHALFVWPLLLNLPRAHLELSRFEPMGAVERLVQEFGCERLVYGSFFPRYAMGPMLYYLHHIGLADEELAAVCAGNLVRILAAGGRS